MSLEAKDIKEQASHIEDADSFEKNNLRETEIDVADALLNDDIADGEEILRLKKIVGEGREAMEKKLLWKMDLRLIAPLIIIFILNFLDRTNIATARLDKLEEDTGLKGTQYNTIIGIFYVGYVLTQFGTNLIISKVRPSVFLPSIMVSWAIVSASCGAVQSFGGWVAIRFILGVVESPFFGGCLFYLSAWYTKKELATRLSIFYCASLMSNAFGSLLGQAILDRFQHDNRGIAAWRWLFIIEGSATVPIAIICMFILPDYPHNTKFLDDKEKALARLRLIEFSSQNDDFENQSIKEGVKAAFTDPALYLLWIIQLGIMTAATCNAFFPTIIGTLGYDRQKTLFMVVPPWVVAAILSVSLCFHSDKKNERGWHIACGLILPLVGFIIAISTMNIAARYFSMFLMLGIYSPFTIVFSWISTTLSTPPAKRSISFAFVNAFANISSTYATYFYPASSSPKYTEAWACNLAFTALAIIGTIVLKFYLKSRNDKLDAANEEDLATEGKRIGSRTIALAKKYDCEPHYRFTT